MRHLLPLLPALSALALAAGCAGTPDAHAHGAGCGHAPPAPTARGAAPGCEAHVAAALDARRALLASCYAAGRSSAPYGRLLVDVQLGADGRVTWADVGSSHVDDPAAEACVLQVVRGLRLAPSLACTVPVSYALVLGAPAQGGVGAVSIPTGP